MEFARGMKTLGEMGIKHYVEVGPQAVLSGMGAECEGMAEAEWYASMRRQKGSEWKTLLESVRGLYMAGAEIDWAGMERGNGRRKVMLPTYPFERERYWIEEKRGAGRKRRGTKVHELLGERIETAVADGMYEGRIGAGEPAFLREHQIGGQVMMPATGYLEMGLAAARETYGEGRHTVEEVEMTEGMVLKEGEERVVQVVVGSEGEKRFRIYSRGAGGKEEKKEEKESKKWTLHASGRIGGGRDAETGTGAEIRGETHAQIDEIRDRCSRELSGEKFYEEMSARGVEFGPRFRNIKRVYCGESEALGEIAWPAEMRDEAAKYQMHPALLDACLQVAGAALPHGEQKLRDDEMLLPIGLERLVMFGRIDAGVWSHAKVQSATGDSGDCMKADIRVIARTGEIQAAIEGLQLKRVTREALAKSRSEAGDDRLYDIEWELALPLERDSSKALDTGRWLIFADRNGTGAALAGSLSQTGQQCVQVFAGEKWESRNDGSIVINPQRPEDYAEVLHQVSASSATPITGVAHLWALDTRLQDDWDSRALAQAEELITGSALHLTQALVSHETSAPPHLWFVTRGSQAAVLDQPGVDAASATLWGFRRVAALEHPELRTRAVDLDPRTTSNEAEFLAEELLAAGDEDQVALRGQDRWVPRLVPRTQSRKLALAKHRGRDDEAVQLRASKPGSIENLELRAAARRAPRSDEIEIRVHAAGLNFRDVLTVLGMVETPPDVLGGECAGVVERVGSAIRDRKPGDNVLAFGAGAFSTFVTVPASRVAKIPAGLSSIEAATIPINFLTAAFGLYRLAQLSKGERVLIHAAAGGVGLAAVQLAQKAGAEVYATAGSHRKRAYLRSLGVQHVYDSRSLAFADEIVKQTNGRRVPVVLNSLSGEFIPKSLSVLERRGRFLEMGKRGIWTAAQLAEARPDVRYFAFDLADAAASNADLVPALYNELLPEFTTRALHILPHTVLPIEQATQAFRWMAGARHIGKIVLTLDSVQPQIARQQPARMRSDGTYLITGGLSGLGLRVARWLVERGVRHLVLLGRSAPSDATAATLHELATTGATIAIERCDVSDEAALSASLTRIRETLPPLRGVVHAAGSLDDGVLSQQTWERFATVMAPKIQGAWNLHRLTRADELDFFVLFSAGAALFGSPGQSNYAAANAFLDALSHSRCAGGLPALSVNWGRWGETGMAATLGRADADRWAAQGVLEISPDDGLRALEQLMSGRKAQVAVLRIDWPKYLNSSRATSALFCNVRHAMQHRATAKPVQQSGSSFRAQLTGAPASHRKVLLSAHVRERALAVLGLALTRAIDERQPLQEMGLDSLMAVELRNTLATSLEVPLPGTLAFDHPTIEAITAFLFQKLPGAQPDASTKDNGPASSEKLKALAELEELSDHEAEELLLRELETHGDTKHHG
ncbi:MAG: SDR family NAD(P)-dependent oxidoreductase [Candidatus Acidiferrales bacterium]